MKKVILALAIVSVAFAACNDSAKKEETPATDTAVVVTPPTVDTTKVIVDTTKPATPDTTKK